MNSVNNIEDLEKKVFINGEHYNELGRSTRKKILEISELTDTGFFVEVGACMGTDTKLLEYKGWNGLLVEPSEPLFLFCKNTRNCIVENYALVSDEYHNNTISNTDISVFYLLEPIDGYPENSNLYKTITFDKLCQKHNITKVDIFILDVEGYEIEILKGIDFDNIDISNFIIEWKYDELFELNNFMKNKGYENLGMIEMLDPNIGLADFYYKKNIKI